MTKSFLILVSSFFLVSVAHAGFYVEPYVGYHMGTVKVELVPALGGTKDDATNNGLAYGAGLGYTFGSGFILGLELQGLSLEQKFKDNLFEDTKSTQLGTLAIVGWEFNKNFRLTLGYGPFTNEDDGDPKLTWKGNMTKLGFSYQFANSFAVGFDYLMPTMLKLKQAGSSEEDVDDNFDKFESNAFVLSLRFPFNFGK